ncbi:MAG: TlyA family RNA methyltransferase [Candidatus Saccharimonadales bacterium]
MSNKTRLDHLLHQLGLTESRSQAATLIMAGKVKIRDRVIDKPGWQVSDIDATDIEILQPLRYVSRAGLKLESANDKFKLDFKDKIVLDTGSSTGGFSDYVLQQGAAKVYAVDVGTNQLHERIRSNPKVVTMEKTDIREANIPERADIALIDVSFISLKQVLPSVSKLIKPQGFIVAMCKPQFEAGVKDVSKHKGVIKNDKLRREILKGFETWARQYYQIIDKADSLVSGAKGNVERFYLLKAR